MHLEKFFTAKTFYRQGAKSAKENLFGNRYAKPIGLFSMFTIYRFS